jgi:hypothetical protein
MTVRDDGEVGSWAIRYLRLSAGQFRNGGAGGIRTLDRPLQAYNGLANRRLQPLGHSSVEGGYARARGEPQAADCRPRSSQPNRQPGFADQARFACFLCNIFQKHRSKGFPRAVFILRGREASVILGSRRRGAPEVVLGGSQEFPRSRGRGEGAKKLSGVPGGHIFGGYGGTCSAFSADLEHPILNIQSEHLPRALAPRCPNCAERQAPPTNPASLINAAS